MLRVRVSSAGWTGGPGLNTFYFVSTTEDQAKAQAVAVRVRAALQSGIALFAAGVVVTVNPQVDVIDPVTGDVTASFITVPGAAVLGNTGSGGRLSPGLCLLSQLKSGTFLEGRRIQGRVFWSGLDTSAAATDGTPATPVKTAATGIINGMAGADAAAGEYVIWRRPRVVQPVTKPPVIDRPGSTATVVTHSVSAKFAVMRSRRD